MILLNGVDVSKGWILASFDTVQSLFAAFLRLALLEGQGCSLIHVSCMENFLTGAMQSVLLELAIFELIRMFNFSGMLEGGHTSMVSHIDL
jgi:hypothetical protein